MDILAKRIASPGLEAFNPTKILRSPCYSPSQIIRKLKRGTFRLEDGDLTKKCSHCREYWPADTEFFFFLRGDLHSYCIACYQEIRWPNGRSKEFTIGRER